MRRVTTTIVILAVLASLAVGLLIGRLAGGSNSKEPSQPAATVTATTPGLPAPGGTPSPASAPATPAPSPAASPAAATPAPEIPLEPTATASVLPPPHLATSTPTPPPMGAMPTNAALPSPPRPAASNGAAAQIAGDTVTSFVSTAHPVSVTRGDGTGGPCSLHPAPSATRTCP